MSIFGGFLSLFLLLKQMLTRTVKGPENPQGKTYFDWNNERLKKWKEDAIKFQVSHVNDNNNTKWFVYKSDKRDSLELRILITICGMRKSTVSLEKKFDDSEII